MSQSARGKQKTAPVNPLEALKQAAEGGHTAQPRARAGVTDNGMFAYRYDDEGRLWATPMTGPSD